MDEFMYRPIPRRELPSFPDLMLQDRVEDTNDYEFQNYELEYDGKVSATTGKPVPRISKIVYKKKSTGEKYIIDMSTKKGEIVNENKV